MSNEIKFVASPDGSSGQIVHNQKTIFLSHFFSDLFVKRVPVPVSVVEDQFLLDFETALSTTDQRLKDISEAKYRSLVTMIASVYSELKGDDLVNKILESGFIISAPKVGKSKPKGDEVTDIMYTRGVVEDLVIDLQKRISNSLSQMGLASLVVKPAIEAERDLTFVEAGKNISEAKMTDFDSVFPIVSDIYQRFLSNEKGDTLSEYIISSVQRSPLLHAVDRMRVLFRLSDVGYANIRKSYVVNQVWNAAYDKDLVTFEEKLVSRYGVVTDVDWGEVSFADCQYMILRMMGVVSGIKYDNKLVKDADIFSIAKQLSTGYGDITPFLPVEAGQANPQRAAAAFKKVFLLSLIERLTSDQPGNYLTQIQSSIAANRFFSVPGLELLFTESLYTISLVYSSILDTCGFFRELADRQDLRFVDDEEISLTKKTKIKDFMHDLMFKNLSSLAFSTNHPAYYKQPAHVYQAAAPEFVRAGVNPEVLVSQSSFNGSTALLTESGSGKISVIRREIIGADLWDYPDEGYPTNRHFVNSAKVFDPPRIIHVPIDDTISNFDYLNVLRNFVPLSKILEILGKVPAEMAHKLTSSASLVSFSSQEEMSRITGLPLKLVSLIWDRAVFTTPKNGGTKDISFKDEYERVLLSTAASTGDDYLLSAVASSKHLSSHAIFFKFEGSSNSVMMDVSAITDVELRTPFKSLIPTKYPRDVFIKQPWLAILTESWTNEFRMDVGKLVSPPDESEAPELSKSKGKKRKTAPDKDETDSEIDDDFSEEDTDPSV